MPSSSRFPRARLLPLLLLAVAGCTDEATAPTEPVPPATPPRAARDSVALFQGAAARVPATANDSGAAGFRLRIVGTGAPAHGSVTVEGDTLLHYLPAAGFVGRDSVRYRVAYVDAVPASADSAVVRFDVRPGPYRAQLLPSGGERWPDVVALAPNGDAVGSVVVDGAFVPVVWRQGGAPVRLPGVRRGQAIAINARGAILGWVEPAGGGCSRPVLWASAEAAPVTLESPGDDPCHHFPRALGDDGTVVALDAIWRNGAWTRQFGSPGPGGNSLGYAYDLGPNGSVLFQSVESYSTTWVWRDGTFTPIPGLGGRYVRGQVMNARGEVAGYAERHPGQANSARLFLWRDGRTTPIEGDYGIVDRVVDLNTAGDILFEEYTTLPGTFIRGPNVPWIVVQGQPFPLQPLLEDQGLRLMRVGALTDAGTIAASALRPATGDTVAVLLRRTP
jgi:hypothetical protein